MGGNQVKESCELVLDALFEYINKHGHPIEGATLSEIASELGLLQRLRGNNFANAVKELRRRGGVLYSEEMRVEKLDKGNREHRVITLALP